MYAYCYDNGAGGGKIQSMHKTQGAAEKAWEKELRSLRSAPGQSQSWLPRVIVETEGATSVGDWIATPQ